MKMTKKVLSILLSLMLVLGVCAVSPFTASAADGSLTVGGMTIDLNNSGSYYEGRVQYDAENHILTLTSFVLEFSGNCISAFNLGFDLTIKGSAKLASTSQNSVSVNGANLILDGDFTLNSSFQTTLFINNGFNLTVEGGSISAVCSNNGIAIYVGDTMTVNGGSVYAKTERGNYAVSYGGDVILNNGEAFALGDKNAKEVLIKAPGTLAGKGTEISPYMIFDYTDLKLFASKVNGGETAACAKLMKDIDASASAETNDWTPIGNYDNKYTGVFDGQGYVIKWLTYNSSADYAGLFGYVGTKTEGGITTKGIVENVGLEGGSITGASYVGGVVGRNYGTVTGCYNTGDVTATSTADNAYAGGVVGYNNDTLTNSYNTGDVTATSTTDNAHAYAGGVVGYNNDTLTNSYNTGNVTATATATAHNAYAYAGGVVGSNNDTLTNSYNTGDVTATATATAHNAYAYAGGVVGYNNNTLTNSYNTGNVTATATAHNADADAYAYAGGVVGFNNDPLTNSYNTGNVTATATADNADAYAYAYAGGVVGYNNDTLTNCYYDSDRAPGIPAIGRESSATHTNVEGLTTAQMTGESALNNMPGFTSDTWLVHPADEFYSFYPHLKGFDYDLTEASEDWPAKVEVSATWSGEDSYTYNGQAQMPSVTSVIIGDSTVPEGFSASYFKHTGSEGGDEISDSPTVPGKYRMIIRDGNEVIETKYFTILEPGADYTVSYSDAAGNPASPVNADKYKAIVTFTDTGYLKGQPPIEKAFDIAQKAVAVTACGPDGPIKAYTGQEQSYTGSVIWIYDREETGLDDSKLRYTGNTTVTGTDAGRHSVDLSADCCVCDDSNYDVTFTAEGDFDFDIAQSVLTITADDLETNYGEDLAGLTYKIEPRFGSYYNTDELGITLSTDADKNKAGTYDITVTVPDNPNYLITTQKGTYTVRQIDPGATVTAEDIDYGQKAVVTFTAPADATGKVTFYLDAADTGITKDIENGQAVCEFEKLNIGSHEVECVYTGDGNYKPGEAKTANFEVKSVDCPLTVNYVYADGSEAAETHTEDVEIFTGYSVTSPGITGYTPDTATVEGTMGNDDMGGKTVTVTYSPIKYTAKFVDENGAVVAEIPYTVETQSIEAPAVPGKDGYSAAWEDYELAIGGVTVKPVYTPENICKLDGEYHGNSFWGRVRTFFHNLIWSIFAFFKLNVFFKVSF